MEKDLVDITKIDPIDIELADKKRLGRCSMCHIYPDDPMSWVLYCREVAGSTKLVVYEHEKLCAHCMIYKEEEGY